MNIGNALKNIVCAGFLAAISPPACVVSKSASSIERRANLSGMVGKSLTEISQVPELYALFRSVGVKRLNIVSNLPFKKVDNASIFVTKPASGGRLYILVDSVITEKVFLDGVMGRVPSNVLVAEIVALDP